MNIDLGQIFQFNELDIQIEGGDVQFVGVTPFMPSDVVLTNNSRGVHIGGFYGEDLFTDHKFLIKVDGVDTMFTEYEAIPEVFDNVISFMPDGTHDKTFVFAFNIDGKPYTYSHYVHLNTDRWMPRLQELIRRETNARRNKTR